MSWQGAPSQDVNGGSLHSPLPLSPSPLGKLGKLVNVVIGDSVFNSTLALPFCLYPEFSLLFSRWLVLSKLLNLSELLFPYL